MAQKEVILFCHACKRLIRRLAADVARDSNKRGYKSYCTSKGRYVYLKRIGRKGP